MSVVLTKILNTIIMKKLLLIQLLFVSLVGFAQTPIYQFNFQTPSATIGTGTFNFASVGNPQSSLNQDADRSNVAGKAVNLQYYEAQATLTGLPLGSSARTISCWVYHRANEDFAAFSYGNAAAGQAFGFKVMPNSGQIGFYGFGGTAYDKLVAHTTILNTWTHYAVSYDGTSVRIYVNGQLKLTSAVALNTANSNFKIGINVANFYDASSVKYDALNIFNVALTDAQIAALFRQNDSQTPLQSGIPTAGLVYANHFTNGNISDSSTTGAVVKTFTTTAGAVDAQGMANNARFFDFAQIMDYQINNYPEMQIGTQLSNLYGFTVSVQVKVDQTYYNNLSSGSYITFYNHGGIYMRILKGSGGAAFQAGYQYTNGQFTPTFNINTNIDFTTNFVTVTYTNNGPNASSGGDNPRLYINNTQFTASAINQLGVFYNSLPVSTIGYPNTAGNNFKGTIDNVFVYNRVLTSTEVAAIVNSTTLSSSDFNSGNLKFGLYPNPSNELVNIELVSEIKSVEIYSLQGQKVLISSEKQINVSNLANGIYMVRVEDENGAVATQKLIKK